MQEKLIVPYPVIVEGKYDKIKLSSIIEAQIIPTAGFGVFKNRELSQLLRKLSQKSMIIVLTDSDGGGKVIRSHISSLIPKDRLIQLYTPQIKGKERRKDAPGAQGLLGVEGMDADLALVDFSAPNLTPCHDPVENLVFAAQPSDVVMNMARGKVIYQNGSFLTLDLEKIKAEVKDYAMKKVFG